MRGALVRTWKASKFHKPDDLVFCTRKGGLVERRNLLRHLKNAATKLGLPKTIDFRSFRTMHASLMSKGGARPETIRDNMGHSEISLTQNIYIKTWWDERVDAVTATVDSVYPVVVVAEVEKEDHAPECEFDWVPSWVPQADCAEGE